MGQDKPTLHSEWATGPGADITEPDAAQKLSGWAPKGSSEYFEGKPNLENMNWQQNLKYQWERWNEQSRYSLGDKHPNQILPGVGTLPSIGATLVISSGDFSAAVYTGDTETVRVPLTALADPPAVGGTFTYATNSDTYWDLRQDCVWVATAVAATTSAPPVASNSVRVFAVRTDGVDRTLLLVDNLTPRATIDIDQIIRHIASLDMAAVLRLGVNSDEASTEFDALDPRISGEGKGDAGELYTQWGEFTHQTSGNLIMRQYGPGSTGIDNAWMMVFGARLRDHSSLHWESDSNATDVFRIVISADDGASALRIRYGSIIGIGPSVQFVESAWENQDQAGQTSQMRLGGGLRLGDDLNQGAAATRNTVPHIEHVRADANLDYTLFGRDATTATIIREYGAAAGAFGSGDRPSFVRTFNAFWNEATNLWNRDDNARDSFAEVHWQFGVYHLFHLLGEAATWSDLITTAASDWTIMKAEGVVAGTTRDHAPTITLGSIFNPGQIHGYGQPISVRRIFAAHEGKLKTSDTVGSNDAVWGEVDPDDAGIAGRAEMFAVAAAAGASIAIPFRMPHESVITDIEVLIANDVAATPVISAWRDDLDSASGDAWERLHAAADTTAPSTGGTTVRAWHSIPSLNAGLTINNLRYKYQVVANAIQSQDTMVYAIRVTVDVPFWSPM